MGMGYTTFSLITFKGGHLTYIFTTKIYTEQLTPTLETASGGKHHYVASMGNYAKHSEHTLTVCYFPQNNLSGLGLHQY